MKGFHCLCVRLFESGDAQSFSPSLQAAGKEGRNCDSEELYSTVQTDDEESNNGEPPAKQQRHD